MNEITIQPNLKQIIADNLLLFLIGIICLLFSGYDNRMISLFSLALLLLVGVVILWKSWSLKATKWIVTQEQIIYTRGVFYRKKDYIELYRVNDFQEVQSLMQQVMGVKTLIILSSDKSHPKLHLLGVAGNSDLIHTVRQRVEFNKQTKRVYEMSNR